MDREKAAGTCGDEEGEDWDVGKLLNEAFNVSIVVPD